MPAVTAFDITELDDADLDRFGSAVTAQRRARAARFRLADDRKRCLAAGVLLRYTLIERAGVAPDDVEVRKNTFGKPVLASSARVHFNLSHAGDWVVCATSTAEVGVDIERLALDDDAGIAHRFAPDEYSYIATGSPAERPRRFAQVWTLKESYMKYLGRGLTVPLNSFSVVAGDRRPRILRGPLDPRPFLRHAVHDSDYHLAVCSADDTGITVERTGLDRLLLMCRQ